MADGGYLVPPSQNPDQSLLWDETWKRLERFLPNMFHEVFPDHVDPPPPVTSDTSNPEETTKSIEMPQGAPE